MGRIKTLIIGAAVAFLVSGLLGSSSEPGGSGIDFDSLLTMGFLVYIWYTVRWATSSKKKEDNQQDTTDIDSAPSIPKPKNPLEPPTSSDEPFVVHINKNRKENKPEASQTNKDNDSAQKKPTGSQIPGLLGSLRVETIKIIHHKAPWAIVERGATIGRFRNTPIPAWIRTSDNRSADYHGITEDPTMDGTVCIEIPESSELILSPGLVFLLRS
ncbi:MAG: hypothetical protein HQL71_11320 [Magnetococcales bacterium]|nr:hypothetical protein [Magnetococcales bacterium]